MTVPGLTEEDFERVAAYLGCEPAAIKAVVEVESAGRSHDAKGRPTALFEKHIFYRRLPAELRDSAVQAGLARPHWVRDYPRSADGVWQQIAAACEIDEQAALESTSWGIGQVMGYWWETSGYNSIQELVAAMKESVGAQLDLLVTFIRANNLHVHLRNLDWQRFARGYNGPAYAQNNYDDKLQAAYNKHMGF